MKTSETVVGNAARAMQRAGPATRANPSLMLAFEAGDVVSPRLRSAEKPARIFLGLKRGSIRALD